MIVSVSLAVLLAVLVSVAPAGGATVAALVRVPVAVALIAAMMVNVTLAPTGRSTVALMAPEPADGAAAPPDVVVVQVKPATPVGRASETVAFVTAAGPELLTTRV